MTQQLTARALAESPSVKIKNFLVDIKGPGLAFLPVLAFEGGTRKNIPRFEVCTSLRSCLYVNSKDKVVRCLVYLWIHHVPMHHRMHIAANSTTPDCQRMSPLKSLLSGRNTGSPLDFVM
uniref:Uncharacterized protein n=1 Tax=Quercus lobata TaxID=97700 RepID=A0A7N2KV00_QUELO